SFPTRRSSDLGRRLEIRRELGDHGPPRGGDGLDHRPLPLVEEPVQIARSLALLLDRVEADLAVVGALEESRERVEVLLRDRVELVVVAARTADREAEEGFSEHLD